MDVSNITGLNAAVRDKAETTSNSVETNKASSNEIQDLGSQEAQTSTIPPAQAPSDFGGKEGSVVIQDNSSSTNTQEPVAESESGSQLDVLA